MNKDGEEEGREIKTKIKRKKIWKGGQERIKRGGGTKKSKQRK